MKKLLILTTVLMAILLTGCSKEVKLSPYIECPAITIHTNSNGSLDKYQSFGLWKTYEYCYQNVHSYNKLPFVRKENDTHNKK